MLKIGLIILNYNDAYRTIECTERALEIPEINHVVIVDNCSTDNSFEYLNNRFKGNCDVIKSDHNAGYAYGNNYGMKFLYKNYDVDIFIISNPDVVFDNKIINGMIKHFKETKYTLITGVMKDYYGNIDNKVYWRLTTLLDDFCECSIVGRKLRKKYIPVGIDKEKDIMEVDVVPGSFFGIRAKDMHACDYLDEGTFLYYEEDILSAKLKKMGYKVGLLTNHYFIHKHINSSQRLKDHKRYLKSKKYYQIKYNNINKLQRILLDIGIRYSILETVLLIPVRRLISIRKKEGGLLCKKS